MHDGVRRIVRPRLLAVLGAAAPAAPAAAAALRVLVVGLGAAVLRAALAVRGGRGPPAAVAGRTLPIGARLLPRVGARLGVGTLAARAATPAPAPAALAIGLTIVVLGLLAVPAGRVVAGWRRLAVTVAGVPGVFLGRRLEDHLGWLERRRRGGRPLRRTRGGPATGRRTTPGWGTGPGRGTGRRGGTGCRRSSGSGFALAGRRAGRGGRTGCRARETYGGHVGAGGRHVRGRRVRRGRLGPGRAVGCPPASLGRRGLVSTGLAGRGRASGACCIYLWRAGAAALLTVGLCIVQLGLEHPGFLPSGSRARRTAAGPPFRAGAGRTRPPGGRRLWPAPLRGALSLFGHVPGPGPVAAWPARMAAAGRPGRQVRALRRGHGPLPCRVALAPAASPGAVTTGRGRPPGGVRPGCRQAVRQALHAEQPFEVLHSRRPACQRHTGRSP